MAQTILIAEDEPSLLKLLAKKLENLGYKVVTASDGEETTDKLKSGSIDLLLLDIIMPKKNGLQVLKELREDMKSDLPVIVLSNLEKPEDIAAGKAYGVKYYMIKSHISIKELAEQITKALRPAA